MRDLLDQVLASIRSWLGWRDLSETRLSPGHGWLLPAPAVVLARHPSAGVPVAVAAYRQPARRG